MFVVTIVAWSILICLPLYGLRAGGGKLLFTGMFLTLSGICISLLAPVISKCAGGNTYYVGLSQLVLFILLSAAAFPFGALLNRFFLLNIDPFDWALGFFVGIVVAFIAVHFFLTYNLTLYHGSPEDLSISHSFLVRQFVQYEGWNQLVHYVTTLDAFGDNGGQPE